MLPLSELKRGSKGRVVSIAAGYGATRRLMEMGLIPGETVEVLSNYFGPVVVRVRGVTFALGRGLASKVLVEVIE